MKADTEQALLEILGSCPYCSDDECLLEGLFSQILLCLGRLQTGFSVGVKSVRGSKLSKVDLVAKSLFVCVQLDEEKRFPPSE